MTSSARSTIDRLATITKKNDNEHELRRFLSTEEVFRCDQVHRSRVFDRRTPLYSPFRCSTTMACHYFTMWREESLGRRKKPMIGLVMRLCKRIKTLRRNHFWYEYVLDL